MMEHYNEMQAALAALLQNPDLAGFSFDVAGKHGLKFYVGQTFVKPLKSEQLRGFDAVARKLFGRMNHENDPVYACGSVVSSRYAQMTLSLLSSLRDRSCISVEATRIEHTPDGAVVRLRMQVIDTSPDILRYERNREQELLRTASKHNVAQLQLSLFGIQPPDFILDRAESELGETLPRFRREHVTFFPDSYEDSKKLPDSRALFMLDTFDGFEIALRHRLAREFTSCYLDLVDKQKHTTAIALGQASLVYFSKSAKLQGLLQCARTNQRRFQDEVIDDIETMTGSDKMAFVEIATLIQDMDQLVHRFGESIKEATARS